VHVHNGVSQTAESVVVGVKERCMLYERMLADTGLLPHSPLSPLGRSSVSPLRGATTKPPMTPPMHRPAISSPLAALRSPAAPSPAQREAELSQSVADLRSQLQAAVGSGDEARQWELALKLKRAASSLASLAHERATYDDVGKTAASPGELSGEPSKR
jgi:hypothetical protein